MKTLLYITVNSKPEHLSASKQVGRAFVNTLKHEYKDLEVKEYDLYEMSIPKLKYQYFKERNTLVDSINSNDLSSEDKQAVARILELAKEFRDADYYVFTTPMWNMMFPSILKEYLDCVVQNDITVKVSPDTIAGLLNDRLRKMVYIQSSGGPVPWILEGKVNHGGSYMKDIFKFVGITEFYDILVDKTGYTEKEVNKAIEKGIKEAEALAKKI